MNQSRMHIPPKIVYVRDDGSKDIYICNEKLGQGGFAVVYRVTQQNTNKSYAMKVILKDKRTCSINKFLLEKIQNEIQIQKKLKHPNIVASKISFSDERNQYIILEYCPGKSIREYLRKSEQGHLTEPETRKILKDVIQGLIYLHKRKIIHHDLKLENFIIGSNGKVKIADFGVSYALKNANDKIFSVYGTTNYMAPEMLQDDNQGHSLEVDIWSIGVSAFIMLTGQQPFNGFEKEVVYENIKKCDYHFPSQIQLSYEARDFIKLILRLDPWRRPTATDLLTHPFLTKNGIEKVQLYKPPIIETINKTKFNSNIHKIGSLNNPNLLRKSYKGIQIVKPKYSNQLANSLKKPELNNLLNYPQENGQSNVLNTNEKKNFIIPTNFVVKYCFCDEDLGYLLGDGTVGVCFIDRSRIIMDPNEEFVQYFKNYDSAEEVINLEEGLNEIQKNKIQSKLSLIRKFAKNLKKFKCLYKIESDYYDSSSPLCHVKYFVKKNDSILFKMNDKNIQVNFNDNKKLLIFWNIKKMCLVKLLKEKCNLLDLKDVVAMNYNREEYKKYKDAKELLYLLSQKI